jgi:bifunctional oligoribonuclease and PAP phosphatase NrnA
MRMNALDALLTSQHRFVLSTHVNPDGDGIGSEVALAEWLKNRGSPVTIVNHSATPAIYDFLDPDKQIREYKSSRDDEVLADAEVIILLDMNHPDRLRSMEAAVMSSPATRVCVDHHLDAAPFAHHYLTDADATSTGEILFRLLERLDRTGITPAIATALYCAIMTDTGSFRYPRVDMETHHIVAELILAGADPVAIYSSVYERWSNGRIHLLGEMLAGLETLADGRLACVTITRDMLKRTGTSEEDTDNFTTYPMSVNGVVVGILFLELEDGVKMSFRSRGDIPINLLAKEFGGNGHKNAAGARLHGHTLDAVRTRVLAAALKYAQPDHPQAR